MVVLYGTSRYMNDSFSAQTYETFISAFKSSLIALGCVILQSVVGYPELDPISHSRMRIPIWAPTRIDQLRPNMTDIITMRGTFRSMLSWRL